MKRAAVAVVQAHQARFKHRPGCFEWLGLDFIVSEDPADDVFLLEVRLAAVRSFVSFFLCFFRFFLSFLSFFVCPTPVALSV